MFFCLFLGSHFGSLVFCLLCFGVWRVFWGCFWPKKRKKDKEKLVIKGLVLGCFVLFQSC